MMKKPIRVLHFGITPEMCGVETIIYNLYKYIDKDRVQFDFVNFVDEPIAYQEEFEKMGAKIFQEKVLSFRKHPIKKWTNSKNIINKYATTHPIIHYNASVLSQIHFAIPRKKSSIPIRIIHSHNNAVSPNMSFTSHIYDKFNRMHIGDYGTNYLACSSQAGKWMFGEKKFTVIKNAIDASKFRYNATLRSEIRKGLGLEGKFVVGHIGRFEDQKNHSYLLKVFREVLNRIPNSVLLLIGDGTLKEQILSEVKNLSLENSVVLLGNNRNDVADLMQAMDVFVFPSKFEGFGIALLEAQASGLSCYTSAKVVPDLVRVTPGLKFLSLDVSPLSWAKHIVESQKNFVRTDTYDLIVANGFDIHAEAKKLEQIYIDLYEGSLC